MSTGLRFSNNCVSSADGDLTRFDSRLTMLPQSLTFFKALWSDDDGNCNRGDDDDYDYDYDDEDAYDDYGNDNGTGLYSVSTSADGHLICGLSGRVEIWDTNDGKSKYSTGVDGNMHGMKQYGEYLYGACLQGNQLTVVRYDRNLTNREEIVSIPYRAKVVTNMDVRYGKIAIIDYDNKLIKLFSTEGEFLRDVMLRDSESPYGVHLLIDNCVLLSARSRDYGAGFVTKYQADGSGSVVWRSGQLQRPLGLDVDELGLIYVCGDFSIYVLSLKGQYKIYDTSSHCLHYNI